MRNLKTIDEVLRLSDHDYRIYFGNLLKGKDAIYNVDKIDDKLLEIVKKRPADVERICRINSIVLAQFNQVDTRRFLMAYNFNTLMIATICKNDIPHFKSIFLEGITFCQENQQYEAGQSLSRNVISLFASSQIPLDEAPYFLTRITEFFKAMGKHQDCVEALCTAATYFADASAFQSAYRALDDAHKIATSTKNIRSLILTLETQGTVALLEGDLNCADQDFQQCFVIYESIAETPPFMLNANAALVKLRKKDYGAAREFYEKILENYPEASVTNQLNQIKINLLVCYREMGDTAATENMSQQIEKVIAECKIEEQIEARLILAKTYFHTNKLQNGTLHLKEACIALQGIVNKYQRLHYRRGVREQYVSRIKSMLMSIEASGVSEDVMHALVFCSSNALYDWFSVLEWSGLIIQSERVPSLLKGELSTKMEDLIRYGTPFMYGFREKYDDPFEHSNGGISKKLKEQVTRELDYSLPWREFNDLTVRICQSYSYPPPFSGASIQNGVNILSRQLLTGSAFLFSFTCLEGCAFVLVTKEKYIREDIPLDNLLQFVKALFEYQRGSAARNTFHDELDKLQMIIMPTMTKIMEILEHSSISELVFIPDHWTEGFPILPAILSNEQLRSRIKESNFIFRTCPALKEESQASFVTGPSLFLFNSEEGLALAESEKDIITKTFADQDCFSIDLQHENIDFSKPPASSAKLLHLATHSIPANIFTDPFFVSSSTDIAKNGVWLESVQREAHKLNYILIFLNGCNTGTTSNNNYFKNFKTNEKVGLSSAFLLNRKSTVIATQWNEPEIAGYIFSSLFYNRLKSQPNIAKSFILALVDLYELSKKDTIDLFEKISNEKERQKRYDTLNQSQIKFPFRNTYFLGMFQCHSLLARKF